MELIKIDIDKLLEATSFSSEEDYSKNKKNIEIDLLLEKTQDW